MIKSIQYIIENSPTNVNIIIENTAGEGSSIGSELEKLHEIYIAIPLELRKRVKICIDTCHAFSAGYDIRSCGGVKIFFEKLDKLFGLRGNIVLIHINDSVYGLGSHKDRPTAKKGRRCNTRGCKTILSIYNHNNKCQACQQKLLGIRQ